MINRTPSRPRSYVRQSLPFPSLLPGSRSHNMNSTQLRVRRRTSCDRKTQIRCSRRPPRRRLRTPATALLSPAATMLRRTGSTGRRGLFADAHRTGSSYTVMQQWMRGGIGPASHVHNVDEWCFVLERSMDMRVDGRELTCRAGDSIWIPRGAAHGFTTTDEGAHVLNGYAPTETTERVSHILALMKQGDDASNRRDKAGMNAAHHPEMIAHITGNSEPITAERRMLPRWRRCIKRSPMSTSTTTRTRSSSVRVTG